MKTDSKIYIAGHKGLAGSSIKNYLEKKGYRNLICRTRQELDLENESEVNVFFREKKPEYVFLCAARVGGINDNLAKPAEFIFHNLKIQNNVIDASRRYGITKLLFTGSSCIYPRFTSQPIKEEYFLTGPLEPTNESYAIAKIAGISLCQSYRKQYGSNFISVMPANLYGPGDHFDPEKSHVIPSLFSKFYSAKKLDQNEIVLWGTGTPQRDFLYGDDLASACEFLMKKYNEQDIINIGTGENISVKELAEKVKKIVGYKGQILWDKTKPDGMPRRLLDVRKINKLGWKHRIDFDCGLENTHKWFKTNVI